jgi:succinate dehydrogenase / fumarate reductase flavoprotein subunit
VVYELGLGLDGQPMVYLDLTHIDRATLNRKLEGILEIYEKFVGVDPRDHPMKIFPGVHYTMGGLWVDFNQMTNIPGIFAAGECEYQYHGANRLGANSLLSCIYAGMVTGPAMASYRSNLARSSWDLPSGLFEKAERREQEKYDAILAMEGDENAYEIHEDLGTTMLMDVTIERHNAQLDKVLSKIDELDARVRRAGVTDTSGHANQGASFIRHLRNMLVIARVITLGARNRDESRGAHYKPEFKERDDKNWQRTTMAMHKSGGGPKGNDSVEFVRALDYSIGGKSFQATDAVDTSLVKPRPRKYETAGAASAAATEDTKSASSSASS